MREDRIVWTFTWEGMPDAVCLETFTFEELGDGRTLLRSDSLYESFEARDFMVTSMESGVVDAYAQLDRVLAAGSCRTPRTRDAGVVATDRHRLSSSSRWTSPNAPSSSASWSRWSR